MVELPESSCPPHSHHQIPKPTVAKQKQGKFGTALPHIVWAPLLIFSDRSDPKPDPIPLVSHRATAYPAAASAAAMAASSSRPLLRRLAELARGRVHANHRMLSSASSSTAAIERASQSPAEAQAVRMTEGCVRVRTSLLLPTSRSFRCIFPNL